MGRALAIGTLMVVMACSESPSERHDGGLSNTRDDAAIETLDIDELPSCPVPNAPGLECDPDSAEPRCRFGDGRPDLGRGDCACDAVAALSRNEWVCRIETCSPAEPDWSLCTSPRALELGATLTNQDSAEGGHGDCARFASGSGGPSLYYGLVVPPERTVRVTATALRPREEALLRVFSDCRSYSPLTGSRGGMLCLRNDAVSELRVTLAVGLYSGEANDLPILFDLSTELIDAGQSCW